MNYLAHLFLSPPAPDSLCGAMLGDFVKGRVPAEGNLAVRQGILLHRAIDRYTDQHQLVSASRALISDERRRFAGILVDMFYDHFLARHWLRYSDRPLTQFTQEVYRVLLPRRPQFPERLQRVLPPMAADDWLASYADVDSVQMALGGLARRFRRPAAAEPLRTGIIELQRQYRQLEAHFLEFFPQLRDFAAAAVV